MYLNSWYISNFNCQPLSRCRRSPLEIENKTANTRMNETEDYGFFCDIENMEPDEVIEYKVIYSNRSDYYHVCRKITRKTEKSPKIETPPVSSYILHVTKVPTVTDKKTDIEKENPNNAEKNEYSRNDVIFPKYCQYFLYLCIIVVSITITLIIELD
jgi:hypothetical protein